MGRRETHQVMSEILKETGLPVLEMNEEVEPRPCPKCGSPNTAVPKLGWRCCFDCGFEWRLCPECGAEMEDVSTCMSDERALALVNALWGKAREIEPDVGSLTKIHAKEIVDYTRERNKGRYVCKNPECGHEEKVK